MHRSVFRIFTALNLNRLDVLSLLSLLVGEHNTELGIPIYYFYFFPFQIVCGISGRAGREVEWLRNAADIYNNLDGIQESDYDIEETSTGKTGNVEYFNLVVIFCSAIFVISPVFLFVCLLGTSLRRNIRKSLLYKAIRKY